MSVVRTAGIVLLALIVAAQAADKPAWAKVSKAQVAEANKLGVPVAFTNSIGMKFVLIPAGKFTMGSRADAMDVARRCNMPNAQAGWFVDEHPVHEVTLTRAFYMAIHELTQSQYEALFKRPPERPDKKSRFHPCDCAADFQGGDRPVINASWDETKKFCEALSKRDAGEGRHYSMPTEAQWEYACRAGTTTPFSFGETVSPAQANYNGEYTYADGKKGENRGKTVPVGSLVPNSWGLYDMHGNVSEYCSDAYGEYVDGATNNPSAPMTKGPCVVRGGAWRSYPGACRSACRLRAGTNGKVNHIGIRLICALPVKPAEPPVDSNQ